MEEWKLGSQALWTAQSMGSMLRCAAGDFAVGQYAARIADPVLWQRPGEPRSS